MAVATIVQGADSTIQLTINDSNGNPITISTLENLSFFVYQKRENILGEYSLGESTISITDDFNGKVAIYFPREQSEGAVIGDLFCEIWVDVQNANFSSGFKRNKFSDVKIGKVINSVD